MLFHTHVTIIAVNSVAISCLLCEATICFERTRTRTATSSAVANHNVTKRSRRFLRSFVSCWTLKTLAITRRLRTTQEVVTKSPTNTIHVFPFSNTQQIWEFCAKRVTLPFATTAWNLCTTPCQNRVVFTSKLVAFWSRLRGDVVATLFRFCFVTCFVFALLHLCVCSGATCTWSCTKFAWKLFYFLARNGSRTTKKSILLFSCTKPFQDNWEVTQIWWGKGVN